MFHTRAFSFECFFHYVAWVYFAPYLPSLWLWIRNLVVYMAACTCMDVCVCVYVCLHSGQSNRWTWMGFLYYTHCHRINSAAIDAEQLSSYLTVTENTLAINCLFFFFFLVGSFLHYFFYFFFLYICLSFCCASSNFSFEWVIFCEIDSVKLIVRKMKQKQNYKFKTFKIE